MTYELVFPVAYDRKQQSEVIITRGERELYECRVRFSLQSINFRNKSAYKADSVVKMENESKRLTSVSGDFSHAVTL